ncbi:glycerate kinase [Lactococcus allomyrinae]|uniref:Glycerate kinase n=1 Tax=Lactococcus allomyrinae TaxID=2419773 RepID=A0A387BGQ2_9LACT|nr:glycerate kinase [Lactococcus allomyrinae]AYG00569.1 glycerate kinase [Lactococcus allomyrinae]
MKIVVAIDSFKGSATSAALNNAVKVGILSAFPASEVQTFEIADGGEGTISALQHGIGGALISVETVDLLERPIKASYLLADKLAVIEAAEVVGIDKITASAETIQQATTRGLAALFIDAKNRGATEIMLSLGGTGTSDGGLGLLQGLGGSFEHLPQLENIKITGLADVTNVYAGETGYARFFGKQKGGTPEILEQQDQEAQKVARQVKVQYGIDLQSIAGTGAAGGLGGAIAMLGGTIEAGFPKIARLLKIEQAVKTADLIITGEGRMDFQTANGKVPYGMAKIAEKYKVPTIAFCGALGDDLGGMNEVLLASYSIQRSALSLAEAMEKERTLENIQMLATNVMKTRYK